MEGKQTFEDLWELIKVKAIDKLERYLTSGDRQCGFTKREYIELYT